MRAESKPVAGMQGAKSNQQRRLSNTQLKGPQNGRNSKAASNILTAQVAMKSSDRLSSHNLMGDSDPGAHSKSATKIGYQNQPKMPSRNQVNNSSVGEFQSKVQKSSSIKNQSKVSQQQNEQRLRMFQNQQKYLPIFASKERVPDRREYNQNNFQYTNPPAKSNSQNMFSVVHLNHTSGGGQKKKLVQAMKVPSSNEQIQMLGSGGQISGSVLKGLPSQTNKQQVGVKSRNNMLYQGTYGPSGVSSMSAHQLKQFGTQQDMSQQQLQIVQQQRTHKGKLNPSGADQNNLQKIKALPQGAGQQQFQVIPQSAISNKTQVFQARSNSHQQMNLNYSQKQSPLFVYSSCYNDISSGYIEEHGGRLTQGYVTTHSGMIPQKNISSMPGSETTPQKRMGPPGPGFTQTVSHKQFQEANKNTQLLYTNISLREASQSPDKSNNERSLSTNKAGKKSKKILIATDKQQIYSGGSNYQKQQQQAVLKNQVISNKRLIKNSSQDRVGDQRALVQPQNVQQARPGGEQARLFHNQSGASNQPGVQLLERGQGNVPDLLNHADLSTYLKQFESQVIKNAGVPHPHGNGVNPHSHAESAMHEYQQEQASHQPGSQLSKALSNQGRAGEQRSQSQAAPGQESGAILNIKTVQDINIYNDFSFIVNTHGGLPVYGSSMQDMRSNSQQAPTTEASQLQTTAPQPKKGLKLRKELSEISNGLAQSRSASQGRNVALTGSAGSNSSKQALQQAIGGTSLSRNNGSFTEHNSYGGARSDQLPHSDIQKVYQAYTNAGGVGGGHHFTHLMSQQNLTNLQQNPNQKRIIGNPQGKMYGNLAVITGMSKKSGISQKKMVGNQTFYYQNQGGSNPMNQQNLKQGIKKILKNKISSNTSRMQSRNDSKVVGSGTHSGFDPNLTNSRVKVSTNNQNQKQLLIQQALGQRAASQCGRNSDINIHDHIRTENQMVIQQHMHQSQKYFKNFDQEGRLRKTQDPLHRDDMLEGSPIRQKQTAAAMKALKDNQDKFNALMKTFQKAKKGISEPAKDGFLNETELKSIFTQLDSFVEKVKQLLASVKQYNGMKGDRWVPKEIRNNGLLQETSGSLQRQESGPKVSSGKHEGSFTSDQLLQLNMDQFKNHEKQYSSQYQIPSQMKNLTSCEIRKQSLQEFMNQNQFMLQAGSQPNKFRNQIQQISSDHDRMTPIDDSQIQSVDNLKSQEGMINYSKSLKNDQFFQHRVASRIGTRLKTEDVSAVGGLVCQADETANPGIQQASRGFTQLIEKAEQAYSEALLLKALCLLDQGQSHEAITEIDVLLLYSKAEEGKGKKSPSVGSPLQKQVKYRRIGFLVKSILQRKIGEHTQATATLSECLAEFPDYKDGYLVRGQIYLLHQKSQRALQDFLKFESICSGQLQDIVKQGKGSSETIFAQYQVCIAKECLGDTYKKMKKYKLAQQSYQEALNEIKKISKVQGLQGNEAKALLSKAPHVLYKVQMKLAMCAYYQGNMQSSQLILEDTIKFYQKFDQEILKTQAKLIKCNYFCGKSILSLKERDMNNGDPGYQRSLVHFQQCCGEEIDPELHELYCGNSLFEIAKVFLRQKDVLNAYEFIQRAADNNYTSKRLSLYRDFTEGVVYLMKKKIKKGVQILTDLLEVLVNGQKEIEKDISKKEKEAKDTPNQLPDRYNVAESDSNMFENLRAQNQAQLVQEETINEQQSTLNKGNLIASGKFSKEMYDFLIFNIYIYRSYGYVAIEKYEYALDDLRKAKKISPHDIDQATVYNKWLSRGILKMDTEEYLMASKYFGKASLRFPENKDSYCLNVISKVRSYSYSLSLQYIDDVIKKEKVEQTLEFLDVAINCCCQDQKQASLYFFRGLLHYQLHNFYEALNDFNVAIQEEEEATGQFHLARGRCYACLSILDEALKDLSIALELDETLLEAYIFRGKCAYLLGDNNLAFHDFQKLIISDQKNPIVHIYAGNLLMTTGAYNDAIKAFDNADTVQQTALASFQRIRCHCALSDLESAFEQMQLCLHLAPNEQFAQYDYKVLLPLLSCVRSFAFTRGENGERDEEGAVQQQEILKTCLKQISDIISKYENNEHMKLKKGSSPMSIQIIPNVNKIRIEKKFALNCLAAQKKDQPYNSISLTEDEKQMMAGVDSLGYYRENIFQLEEMYLYRSVFNLYIGNYEDSIVDLNRSWRQHFQQTQQAKNDLKSVSNKDGKGKMFDIDTELNLFSASQLVSPINSVHSQTSAKTDLSDIGLCSLNVREYNYNLIICLIQMKSWDKALKKVNEELSQNPMNADQVKSIKQLFIARAMIHQELGHMDKYNQDLTVYLKHFSKLSKNEQNAVVIEPFEAKGRLCQYFDPIPMNFQKPKSKSGFNVWMRPSFSMPFIKPPNMIPNIDEEIVQNEFNLKQIDAPMPEAPWVRNCKDQNFNPFTYLQKAQEVAGKEAAKQKQYQTYALDSSKQQFLQKYTSALGRTQEIKGLPNCIDLVPMVDDKMVEDIDDLSDTDKVSLISDIEISQETQKSLEKSPNKKGGNELNLHDISKINKNLLLNKQSQVKKVHNGVKLTSQKYLCGRRKSCSSCYHMPEEAATVNVADQQQLVSYLMLTKEERAQRQRKAAVEHYASLERNKQHPMAEDTVSEEEYLSSSDSDDDEKKGSKAYSNTSHSRFSSNIGEMEAELDEIKNMMGQGLKDIDAADVVVQPAGEGKKLMTDKRNLMKKPEAVNHLREAEVWNDVNNKIGSIQRQELDVIDFQDNQVVGDQNTSYSPQVILDDSPKKQKISKKVDNNPVDRDSMVVMGSKNMDRAQSKKKSRKQIGNLGGTNNLKKNKLAIAFNNLEMEHHHNHQE